MMTIKELIFTEGHTVSLQRIDNGHAVYWLMNAAGRMELEFRVPPEDLRGATFKLTDTPRFFMRWVRHRLNEIEDERIMIEQARKEALDAWLKSDPPS